MKKTSVAKLSNLPDRTSRQSRCDVGLPYQQLPVGIASQRTELANFFGASVELMQVMARACGHDHLSKFNADDLTTWKREMADLSGVAYGGFNPA
jgi:hypothetical protein